MILSRRVSLPREQWLSSRGIHKRASPVTVPPNLTPSRSSILELTSPKEFAGIPTSTVSTQPFVAVHKRLHFAAAIRRIVRARPELILFLAAVLPGIAGIFISLLWSLPRAGWASRGAAPESADDIRNVGERCKFEWLRVCNFEVRALNCEMIMVAPRVWLSVMAQQGWLQCDLEQL